jgi:hypothetical protein
VLAGLDGAPDGLGIGAVEDDPAQAGPFEQLRREEVDRGVAPRLHLYRPDDVDEFRGGEFVELRRGRARLAVGVGVEHAGHARRVDDPVGADRLRERRPHRVGGVAGRCPAHDGHLAAPERDLGVLQ